MSVPTEKIVESVRLIHADCETDALAVDSTPFTPLSMGTALGQMFAMVSSIAKAVELLAHEGNK